MSIKRLLYFTVIVLFALGLQTSAQTDPLDAKALQDLYRTRNIPSQLKGWKTDAGGWKTDAGDLCAESWTGVTCNSSSIIHIIIPGLQLGGNLGFQLSNLHNLKQLDIKSKHIQGEIPYNLPANVTHFQIMPYSLINMKQLRHINLSHKSLFGPIVDIFTGLINLKEINLSYNNFTGDLPSSFGSLKNLTRLFLESNGFTGSVIFLSNLPFSDLDIQDNHSSGVIPETFQSIENLWIGGNRFHRGGNYPPWFFPLDTPNITSPPSTKSSAVENYPSHRVHKHKKKGLGPGGIASVVGGVTLLAACAAFYALARIQQKGRRLRRLEGSHSSWQSLPVSTTRTVRISRRSFSRKSRIPIGTKIYSVAELQAATDSFSEGNLLGEGSLSSVYKAEFPSGQIFAVKNINTVALALHEEDKFLDVIWNVARLRHPNIVKLVGYCIEHGQHILVYEHIRNLSLDDALHCDSYMPLSWGLRLRVALGVARALNYLHSTCVPPVAHSNLKAANILLDENLMPHICNTGLAVLKPLTSNRIKIKASEMAIGDTGYIAPENIQSGIDNMKGDVYAFGVLLLELLTGRRPFDSLKPRGEQSLVNWASSELHDNKSLEQMVDPAIKRTIPSKTLSRFAAIISLCIQPQKEFRPPMTEIQEALMCILQEHRIVRGYSAADSTEGPLDRSLRSSNSRSFSSPTLISEDMLQRRDADDAHEFVNPADVCQVSGAKVAVIDLGYSGKLTDTDIKCFESSPIHRVFHSPQCNSKKSDTMLHPHGFSCASVLCGARRDVNFFEMYKYVIQGACSGAELYTYALGCGGCTDLVELVSEAIDQAIKDRVKVISMSVGRGILEVHKIDHPTEDDVGMKTLDAYGEGILTINPVGNEGPVEESAIYSLPWGFTVGASTNGLVLVTDVEIAIKEAEKFVVIDRLQGVSFNMIETQFLTLGVDEYEFWNDERVLYSDMSSGKCFLLKPRRAFRNRILSPNVSSDSMILISKEEVDRLHTWHTKLGAKICARILKSIYIKDERGDIVTNFSSRGPSRLYKDNITPDVVAPGFAVRMSHPSSIPLNYNELELESTSNKDDIEKREKVKKMLGNNTIASGTSYACPYVAACSLIVWSRYPKFNPSAVKSALITTATSFAARGVPGNEFTYGAGSIDLKKALNPGLVYEETYDHFKEYVYDEREIFDLNLPTYAASFSYSHGKCKRNFSRKLKDVNLGDGAAVVYTSKVHYFNKSLDPNVEIKVTPPYLEFKPGEEHAFVLSVEINPHPGPRLYVSAMLEWVPSTGGQCVCSPIHLYHQSMFDDLIWYQGRSQDLI